jgi:hypothetical protein
MDNFSDIPTTLTAPARDAAPVTPSDSTNLTAVPRALYVGQAGDLSVLMAGGQSVVFSTVPAGLILPVRAVRVNATGTTAAGIVALW